MRLRRKIGADPRPITPIARVPCEIRRLEAGLVAHIREDMADVLECRDRIEAIISFKIPAWIGNSRVDRNCARSEGRTDGVRSFYY
jgi:hypothetical protein